jgi:hypothetical protein
MVVPMGTDVGDDLERLRVVAQNAVRSKQRKQALGARTLTDIGGLLPGRLMGLAQRQQHRIASVARRHLIFNLPVTNVPGSRSPFFLSGARVVDVFGLGPVLDGTGLLAIVGSYCGSLTITVTADRQMLPDPAVFGDCLQETVDALTRKCRPESAGAHRRSKAASVR